MRKFIDLVEWAATDTPEFKAWFGASKIVDSQGRPLVLYHGTGSEFSEFVGMVWGSISPALANEYAFMRDQMGGRAAVIPVYMKAEKIFDADLELSRTVSISVFFNQVLEQAMALGFQLTESNRLKSLQLLNTIRACAREEESGPHYDRHNFWNDPGMMFGRKGAQTIMEFFQFVGFDGIKMQEDGEMTYGVFSPNQVRFAL